MKRNILILATSILLACTSQKHSEESYAEAMPTYMNSITASALKEKLYVFASDSFQGRKTGEFGQHKAANWLKSQYENLHIPYPKPLGSYFQVIPHSFLKDAPIEIKGDSENVLAFIEGSEKPEEVIVVSAHMDHLGLKGSEVYNGADDDGSGSMAVLQIATAMQKAVEKGFRPKRSILFLHVTGEEEGLYGSEYYSENPVYPLNNTVADLNIDMIGRVDDAHLDNINYVYPIGSAMLSNDLHDILEAENAATVNLTLDYKYDDINDPNKFYYRSDHYNFAKHKVPVIFFFNGVHADYHKITDTPEKINYPLLAKRTQLVFAVLWQLANQEKRIKLNEVS